MSTWLIIFLILAGILNLVSKKMMKKWDEPMEIPMPDRNVPEVPVHALVGEKEDIFERNARMAMEQEQDFLKQKGFMPLLEMSDLIRQSETDHARNEAQSAQSKNKRQQEKPAFDLREAVIYSEILRPKYKEF